MKPFTVFRWMNERLWLQEAEMNWNETQDLQDWLYFSAGLGPSRCPPRRARGRCGNLCSDCCSHDADKCMEYLWMKKSWNPSVGQCWGPSGIPSSQFHYTCFEIRVSSSLLLSAQLPAGSTDYLKSCGQWTTSHFLYFSPMHLPCK